MNDEHQRRLVVERARMRSIERQIRHYKAEIDRLNEVKAATVATINKLESGGRTR